MDIKNILHSHLDIKDDFKVNTVMYLRKNIEEN